MDAQATTNGEEPNMAFNSLEQTHEKLSQNPEISDHNKEVLNEFFRKQRSSGGGDATVRDYASRFNSLAPHIDFDLDEPEKRDIEDLIAKFNQDEIRKQDGGRYSDHSKAKFWKTLSVFYRSFIEKEGDGYNPDIEGSELLEGLELRIDPVVNVEPETKAVPREIKEITRSAGTLRDKALILFGWSTGARIGELVKTEYDPDPIRWEDIKFKDDYMEVKISEQGPNSRGKTGERTIPIRIGMPLMKKFYEEENPDLEDPVFQKQDSDFFCPKCDNERVDTVTRASYKNRKYRCPECGWEGKTDDVDKRVQPMSDDAVRRVLEKTYERSPIDRPIDYNPHAFFRKARALHKASIGWTEYQLRGFFGWSENSDAPKHYITIVKQGLLSAMKEEFGNGVIDEDLGFSEDEYLKPIECQSCQELNSNLNDYCRNCDEELDDEILEHNKSQAEMRAHETEETLVQIAKETGMDEKKFRDLVRERRDRKKRN